jgi:hypothetical protein
LVEKFKRSSLLHDTPHLHHCQAYAFWLGMPPSKQRGFQPIAVAIGGAVTGGCVSPSKYVQGILIMDE